MVPHLEAGIIVLPEIIALGISWWLSEHIVSFLGILCMFQVMDNPKQIHSKQQFDVKNGKEWDFPNLRNSLNISAENVRSL